MLDFKWVTKSRDSGTRDRPGGQHYKTRPPDRVLKRAESSAGKTCEFDNPPVTTELAVIQLEREFQSRR
jgi:hypothetical protein